MCVLYVVKAGRGRIQVREGCFGAETAGEAGWLEGREGPPGKPTPREISGMTFKVHRSHTMLGILP